MKHAHLIVPHTLVAGSASGELLYAPTGLSLWGGVDRRSAEVIDRHHPLSGRHLHGRLLAIDGLRQRQPDRDALKAFGARLVTDTCWCMLDEPLVPPGARTLMTNSVTYAHYAPGLTGRQVRFAGLADCVEAGVGGRAPAGLPAWLSEDC